VWLGNTENEALKQVTGQAGAGAIWHDVMNLLLESEYNKQTLIGTELLTQYPISNSNEWGLKEDVVENHKSLLLDEAIILSPYENDSFEFFEGISIPLKAKKIVKWSVNGKDMGANATIEFKPESFGNYEIIAIDEESNQREIIRILVVNPL
jgi:membrane carboxypeptidase/penicillin-binding protein PbpC